jgi:hypothetical protein
VVDAGEPRTVNSVGGDVRPAYVEDEAGSTVLYFTHTRTAPAGFAAADVNRTPTSIGAVSVLTAFRPAGAVAGAKQPQR